MSYTESYILTSRIFQININTIIEYLFLQSVTDMNSTQGIQECKYERRLISNAHSEIFCQLSKVAMDAQCVLVATTLLHSGAKFHSFLYTGSKTVRVSMELLWWYVNEIEATCGD